eukprot:317101-Chlamydomonas_euryale.AAC.1
MEHHAVGLRSQPAPPSHPSLPPNDTKTHKNLPGAPRRPPLPFWRAAPPALARKPATRVVPAPAPAPSRPALPAARSSARRRRPGRRGEVWCGVGRCVCLQAWAGKRRGCNRLADASRVTSRCPKKERCFATRCAVPIYRLTHKKDVLCNTLPKKQRCFATRCAVPIYRLTQKKMCFATRCPKSRGALQHVAPSPFTDSHPYFPHPTHTSLTPTNCQAPPTDRQAQPTYPPTLPIAHTNCQTKRTTVTRFVAVLSPLNPSASQSHPIPPPRTSSPHTSPVTHPPT